MKISVASSLGFIIMLLVISISASAQCAMCAAVPESAQGAGSSVADGLNKGILFLFLTPYIVIATIAYFWWKSRKKDKVQVS